MKISNLKIVNTVTGNRINNAKAAFTTRRVDFSVCHSLQSNVPPKSGDIVLARVAEIGQQTRLQLTTGRRAHLFPGDEIIVVYGNRYAPDQFEGTVPKNQNLCHLVAAGGVAAQLHSKNSKMKTPTVIEPIGLLTDKEGETLNLSQFALEEIKSADQRPLTLAVAGTSMNSGKTTTVASLVKGFTACGMKVGAAKLTGTGSGGDVWLMVDSGAHQVLDFGDAGFPSTYLIPLDQIENIVTLLTDHLTAAGVDIIVLEIADGLYQEETAHLLNSQVLKNKVDGMLFAAGEAMGAKAGVEWM
ncbi:MAG: DUF1611 domain-containing protein, partial [Thermodesulfobacteriota bacterium]|nr:DUF1611 domain-containing protein [Thermodesulfobacteriota bacterium]